MSHCEILACQLTTPPDVLKIPVYVVLWVCSLLWVLTVIDAARHRDWMPLLALGVLLGAVLSNRALAPLGPSGHLLGLVLLPVGVFVAYWIVAFHHLPGCPPAGSGKGVSFPKTRNDCSP
jgi:hypothetical protein